MPTPTIPNGRTVMNATLYTGTGAGSLVVNNSDLGSTGFYPDLIWIKSRNAAYYNTLLDYQRGASVRLFSNLTDAESNNGCQSSFNANGFTLNADSGGVNNSGTTYVAWQWLAGAGSSSTNNNGSISSNVDVNTTAGFSIVTYTGNAVISTIGHGLGVAPAMMIIKARNAAQGWLVYHQSIGNTGFVYLNGTDAANYSINGWNNTSPTSTVFTTGVNSYSNASGQTQVAYCWTPIAGYSAFGSYTGNGSTDGTFVYLGFRPKFVMFKGSSIASNWCMLDSSRNTYNLTDATLQANSSANELTNLSDVDFLSNGIKIRDVVTNDTNVSGQTYIYMAFAENPFKYANAR
jgi:hypothetical protein